MARYRILICGGGFAGLAAAWRLSRARDVAVTLVDARAGSHFLPLLPDVIGRGIAPGTLVYPFSVAARRWGFAFEQRRILQIDPHEKRVVTETGALQADALLVTIGSESLPLPPEGFTGGAFRLDEVADAVSLRHAVQSGEAGVWVVCGGGYTGVEIASQLHHAVRHSTAPPHVCLMTNTDRLCPTIPASLSAYLQEELHRVGVEVRTNETVTGLEGDRIHTGSGETIADARLVWTIGVQGAEAVRTMPVPMEAQGRVTVDACLRVMPGVHAAGDAAGFQAKGSLLRMGIQAAISGGWHAAGNILRERDGNTLQPFRPFDPGYVVPLAHGKGCGTPLGVSIRGRVPVWLHYFMSWVRTWGIGRRMDLLREAFGNGGGEGSARDPACIES